MDHNSKQFTLSQTLQLIQNQLKQQNFKKVDNLCQQILKHHPNQAETLQFLGLMYQKQNQLEQAKHYLQQAVKYRSDKAEFRSNLGVVLQDLQQLDQAIEQYQLAILIKPDFVAGFHNYGLALQQKGEFDRAKAAYHTALALKPDYAEGHYNLGCLHHELLNVEPAIQAYRKAIELEPDYISAHRNLAMMLLVKGELIEGFAEYEWRLKTDELKALQATPKPQWQGEALTGKTILVRAEQGLGDTIQFIRYLPWVKQQGGKVILECPPPLLKLFQYLTGVDQLLPRTGKHLPDKVHYDVYVPLLSLAYYYKTHLDNIPLPECNPIRVPPKYLPKWQTRMTGHSLRIGLVWAGSPQHPKDKERSCQLRDFAPFAELTQYHFYSLQKGETAKQADDPPQGFSIQRLDQDLDDFTDTATVIAHLDLIITVDTAVAHLAAAMNKPTWVLLAFNPDWRWLLQRSDSPWYPSMRLFRQAKVGDWTNVIQQITQLLKTAKIQYTDTTATQ